MNIATYRRLGGGLRRGTAVAAMLALAAPLTAHALPKGGTVIEGSARIIQLSPNKLEIIDKTRNAEIEWQSFDIGKGQTVIFIEGGKRNAVLNEIQGGQTVIDGKLIADGTLILINAHGILFGADARAAVSRLIASTANVSFADLAAGRLNFSVPGAAGATIGNAGDITARQGGLVAFIAPNVVNSGIINAKLGKVALAGGDAATLDLYGDGLISIVLGGNSKAATIRQNGKIFAGGGTIQLTASQAKSLVESVINLDGVVRADTVSRREGTIVLEAANVNVSGKIAAEGATRGTTGGTVAIDGGTIHLKPTAYVSASGEAGGGSVLIGRGRKHRKPRAKIVVADAGSTIRADATRRGRGGHVVVWSRDETVAHGTISAVGAGGGKGGFIETSSARQLIVDGMVHSGAGGQWLLDPYNITIGNSNQNSSDNCGVSFCTVLPTGGNSIVSAQTIDNSLNQNSEVVVKTTGAGTDAGDITVASAIQKTAGGDSLLVLQADRSIVVNADISSTQGKLGVDLISGTSAGAKIALNGNFTLNGGQFDAAGPVIVQQSTIESGGGNIFFHHTVDGPGNLTLNAGNGTIEFSDVVGGGSTLGGINIQSAQFATFDNAVLTQSFTQEAGNNLHFMGILSVFGANNSDAVNITANTVLFDPGATLTANGNVKFNVGSADSLTFASKSDGSDPALVRIDNGSFTQTGSSGSVFLGGDVTTHGGDIIFNGFVLATNPNGIKICSTGPACDTNYSTGDVTFTNSIDSDSQVTANYDLTISAAQFANLNFVGFSHAFNNVTIDADTISAAQVNAAGNLVMAAAGANTPPGLGAAITGTFDAQHITVGARDPKSDLPPMEFSGTIAGQQPSGTGDTSHLPTLATNSVVGTGPYTFDNVCFAACGNKGGGGNGNGGTSIAGLNRAEASVLLELETALTTVEQQEVAAILPTLPTDAVVAVLDQLEGATPEQRQQLLALLKTVNIAKLAQDSDAATLIAKLAALIASSKSGNGGSSIDAEAMLAALQATPTVGTQDDGGTLVATGPAIAAGGGIKQQTGTIATTQASGDKVHYSLESLSGPASTAATPDQITQAYQIVFGRAPNTSEMNAWVAAAQARGWTGGQINQFLNAELQGSSSNAIANRDNIVTEAFVIQLGRPPTAAELAKYASKNMDYADTAGLLSEAITAGPGSFQYATGAAVRADMVIRSYETNLGRPPSQGELDYWDNQLLTGKATFASMSGDNAAWYRSQLGEQASDIANAVQTVFGTTESQISWSSVVYPELVQKYGTPQNYQQLYNDLEANLQPGGQKLAISQAFEAVYGRQPTAAELKTYLGTTDANGQLGNYADFVSALTQQRTQTILDTYNAQLGRDPTPAELASATKLFASGEDRGNLVNAITPTYPNADHAAMVIRAYVSTYNRYPTQAELNAADDPNATAFGFSDSYTSMRNYLMKASPGAIQVGSVFSPPTPEGTLSIPGGFAFSPSSDGTFRVSAKPNASGSFTVSAGGQGIVFRSSNGVVSATSTGNIVAGGGGNIVAGGGGNLKLDDGETVTLISEGGSNVVNTNGSNVVNTNGSNVVSNDGGSVVSNDGGSVISNDGGSVVSNDGGSLTVAASVVSNDGGSLVAEGGGMIVSAGGGNFVGNNSSSFVGNNSSSFVGNNSSSLVGENGNGIINQNNADLIGQGTSTLIGQGTSTLIGQGTSTLIGQGTSTLIGQGTSTFVGNNSSSLIPFGSMLGAN